MTPKNLRHQLILYSTMIALLIGWSHSEATLMRALSLQELVEGSSFIVQGHVIRIRSNLTADKKAIVSYLDIVYPPEGLLFDDPQRNANVRRVGVRITLKLLGGIANVVTPEGKVEKRALVVVGNPSFQTGEEVLLFLQPGTGPEFGGYFRLAGMAQAKWRIENGIATRRTHGAKFVGRPPDEALNELPIAQLQNEIRLEIQRQNAQQQRR